MMKVDLKDQNGVALDHVAILLTTESVAKTRAALRGHFCDQCDSIKRGVPRCAEGIRLGEAHQRAIAAVTAAVLPSERK